MVCWSDAGPYVFGFRAWVGVRLVLVWCGWIGARSLPLPPSDLLTLAYSLTLPLFDVSFVVITLCYFSFRSVPRAELLSDIVSVSAQHAKQMQQPEKITTPHPWQLIKRHSDEQKVRISYKMECSKLTFRLPPAQLSRHKGVACQVENGESLRTGAIANEQKGRVADEAHLGRHQSRIPNRHTLCFHPWRICPLAAGYSSRLTTMTKVCAGAMIRPTLQVLPKMMVTQTLA